MFRFNKPTSGSLLLCFAKIMIIKIVVKNVVMSQFGRVAAHLSSPYWCVYSAESHSALSLYIQSHCALCTVHTVSLCTVHTVSLYTVHCTYSLTLHCHCTYSLTVHCTYSLTVHCALYIQSHCALCTVHTVSLCTVHCTYSLTLHCAL